MLRKRSTERQYLPSCVCLISGDRLQDLAKYDHGHITEINIVLREKGLVVGKVNLDGPIARCRLDWSNIKCRRSTKSQTALFGTLQHKPHFLVIHYEPCLGLQESYASYFSQKCYHDVEDVSLRMDPNDIHSRGSKPVWRHRATHIIDITKLCLSSKHHKHSALPRWKNGDVAEAKSYSLRAKKYLLMYKDIWELAYAIDCYCPAGHKERFCSMVLVSIVGIRRELILLSCEQRAETTVIQKPTVCSLDKGNNSYLRNTRREKL